MTYETAKKLQDAGFPYKHTGECEMVAEHNRLDEMPLTARVPTLEELIEACGKTKEMEFAGLNKFVLWFNGKDWSAGYFEFGDESYIDDSLGGAARGSTPEEAVAMLWLALNKK